MSGWGTKRFWSETSVVATDGGFRISLDGRLVFTPAKAPLVLPTRAMADAVAGEWAAQEGKVDPRRMPVTCSANAAIDKVTPQFDEVVDLIAAYGGSDLLCYRAEYPQELIARQAAAWDPPLVWAKQTFGARLAVTSGIVPVAQSVEALDRLTAEVQCFSAFGLVALHDLVGLTGSLVLGLAAAAGYEPAETIWSLSRIDEDWQAEQWGEDAEATQTAGRKRDDFLHAHRFLSLCVERQ
ncbi:MAG: ATP12 family protein [Albidovulum sp.]